MTFQTYVQDVFFAFVTSFAHLDSTIGPRTSVVFRPPSTRLFDPCQVKDGQHLSGVDSATAAGAENLRRVSRTSKVGSNEKTTERTNRRPKSVENVRADE